MICCDCRSKAIIRTSRERCNPGQPLYDFPKMVACSQFTLYFYFRYIDASPVNPNPLFLNFKRTMVWVYLLVDAKNYHNNTLINYQLVRLARHLETYDVKLKIFLVCSQVLFLAIIFLQVATFNNISCLFNCTLSDRDYDQQNWLFFM